jgi:hypothetical protein
MLVKEVNHSKAFTKRRNQEISHDEKPLDLILASINFPRLLRLLPAAFLGQTVFR